MTGICSVCGNERRLHRRQQPNPLAGQMTCNSCYWKTLPRQPCLICKETRLLVARTTDGTGVCARCLREYVNLGDCSRCGKQDCGVVKPKNGGPPLCRSCANNKPKTLRTRPCMGCRAPLPDHLVRGQKDPQCRTCFLTHRGRTRFPELHRQDALTLAPTAKSA